MTEKIILKKMTTTEEVTIFWGKKREYERRDIFPNLKEKGKELEEIIK